MLTKMKSKTFSELMSLNTFDARLNYLYIGDKIGRETFGNSRWINQRLYKSYEWKRIRSQVIVRDNGFDLGFDGCGLSTSNILVHHINPITEEDIVNLKPCVFDMDNLISTSLSTHNFIHYGISLQSMPLERTINDTCPWKK